MKAVSRTENITRNVSVTVITQVISLLFAFLNRTIFIRLLGENYLGLDGLFTSILTIFSLAELGIGNALVFSLYKPIAEGNTQKATQLLTLYDKAYRIIIAVIIAVGLILAPFLPGIVKTDISSLPINLYVIYALFLLNTVSSYFMAYRGAILLVNQHQSITSIIRTSTKISVNIIECILLLVFHSYYIYLIVRVVGNYVSSLIVAARAKKEYPELCVKNKEPLPRPEVKRIAKDVYALFIRRVGSVVLSSVDNIVINAFISLAMVGIYSNYVLIVTSVQGITTLMMSAMTASIGNYIATQNEKDIEKAFRLFSFITYLLYGFCSICLIVLCNRFVSLLWGDNYLLSNTALYLIVFNFFLYGFQSSLNIYRDAAGLFIQGKYRPIFSALVNIGFSLLLVRYMGIEGIILGTILSRILVSSWFDPYILYKKLFTKSPSRYFLRLVLYICSTFIVACIIQHLTDYMSYGIWPFLLCVLICVASFVFIVLPFIKSSEMSDLRSRLKGVKSMLLSKFAK